MPGFNAHDAATAGAPLDAPAVVERFIGRLLDVLFPCRRTFSCPGIDKSDECDPSLLALAIGDLEPILRELVEPAEKVKQVLDAFVGELPAIRRILKQDTAAAYEGDPAAVSKCEVLLAYPCIRAIAVHRAAHALYNLKVPILPRMMSEFAHSKTGIDIHPGAKIGERFFIDHGTGVVIGETTVIGRNVKLYQGVTLGALSFPRDESTGILVKGIKRHPNVEDNVVIYAGATILGGETTIGHDSEIGGNVWIMESIPPCSRVYNRAPAPEIRAKKAP